METPAQRVQKYLKAQFAKFAKTPYVIPFSIAVAAGIFFLVVKYAPTFCLGGLIAPLVLLGLLWQFGIKTILKLLVIGAIACVAFSGVSVLVYTDSLQHISPVIGTSENKATLTEGTVTPLYDSGNTVFHFTVTVRLNNSSVPVSDVGVVVANVGFPSSLSQNKSMVEVSRENHTVGSGTKNYTFIHYAYDTTLSEPVNEYYFVAKIEGTWYLGADFTATQASPLLGPVSTDSFAVAGAFAPIVLINVFIGTFPVYAIILLMIWWTRRARKSREEQLKKWEAERTKEEAKMPDEKGSEAKVPSLRKAMGHDEDEGGSFVCSECGADVPANATRCPNCGEKFE